MDEAADATAKIKVAKDHLDRAQSAAREDPADWLDLSIHGFYALENALDSACLHYGIPTNKSHPYRVKVAKRLCSEYGLTDVSELLRDLNEVRKGESYGEVTSPELIADDVIAEIEAYVEDVAQRLKAE